MIRPEGPVKRRLALVGKGLTFDSGGYNLKVGGSQIELMKFDMGGCGAVLGAARTLAELKLEGLEIHVISAATENMVSAEAIYPGAIVTASNGKTIEINNTDAEGRLTLADALVYACGLEPDAIVDLATLTGACVIALGDEIAGYWSPDDGLAEQLKDAAHRAGEGLWRMPLQSSYKDGLKSGLADMKNTGPRPGWLDHRSPVPQGVRQARDPLGSHRHRRPGVERQGPQHRSIRRHWLWGSHPGGVVPGSCC